MKPLGVVSALVVVWPLLLAPGGARGAALSAAEQAMLEELLGQGVIGEPVAGSPLTPSFAPLREGTSTYRIVGGKEKGQTEEHVVTRLERDPTGASWRYAVGAKGIVFIKEAEDGSLTFVTEENTDQGVITRYEPAEPGLLAGLAPGDSKASTVAVKVYDLSSPQDLAHEGRLDVTYSYLGAYKVNTPAGSYDAALIKWTYQGKVGPAKIDDTQYRFFADNVGMVASVDKLDVSAFLVYQDHTKFGKLLAQAPQ
ncbi:MAG: TapB family protein [Geminicoccaceae bacterium]